MLRTLSFEDVMQIHDALVVDFAASADPISPPGVRDDGALLHSAVGRQHVGLDDTAKYGTPHLSAATLCYGICNNHCFHNGNKRTALVSLLCHLDRNDWVFDGSVQHDELYELMLQLASHTLPPRRKRRGESGRDADAEVHQLGEWVRRRSRKLQRGDRVITFRQLRQALRPHSIELENPSGNYIDVVKYETVTTGLLFFKKSSVEARRIAKIPYPREGNVVGRNVIRSIREAAGLTEADGVDSQQFYASETPPDVFISRYRSLLRRLAKV